MSIVKINSNVRYTPKKITTLKVITNIGTVQKCFNYAGTSRDTIPCLCKPRDTVQIRCSMPSSATGYFFGNMNSGCQFAIRSTATNIEWYNGSATAVATKSKSGIDFSIPHTYGFLEGKPIFDNALVDATYTAPEEGSTTSTYGYGIGQALGVTSKITEVSVYRFDIIAYAGDTSGGRRTTHYYPIVTTSNAVRWYDLFSRITQSTYSNNYLIEYYDSVLSLSSATSLADGEQYGIQLDDMRYITQSGYKDLLAILTQDDSSKALPGADSAYIINGKHFAFKIANVPSGATTSGGESLADGELIKGRRPKWNIWHDIIKFGKYATSAQPHIMHFNIFKDNKGNALADMLGIFDGYTEDYTNDAHKPSFSIDGNVNMEWHNGFCDSIALADKIIGNAQASSGADEQTIFRFRRTNGGMSNVILGNLPLWNYTPAEQNDAALDNMRAIGGGAMLMWQNGSAWARFATMVEFIEQTDANGNIVPFSTLSDTATINKFRKNGFGGEFLTLDRRIDEIRRHFIIRNTNAMTMKSNIVLARTTEIDNNDAIVDCSNLMPNLTSTFNGAFDNRISPAFTSTTNVKSGDRVVYADTTKDVVISGTAYQMWAQGQSANESYANMFNFILSNGSTNYGNCIALPVAMISNNNAQTALNLFDSYGIPIIAVYAVITEWDATNKRVSGRYNGFASMLPSFLTNRSYDIQGEGYGTSYSSGGVPCANGVRRTISSGQGADAIFMWKDLTGNSQQTRPSNPMTSYVRAFALASAPHAWALYGTPHFDASMEADYISLPTPKLKFVFHNYDRLVGADEKLATYFETFTDSWMTLWDTNTNQRITSQWSKLNGRTIKVYESMYQDIHSPKDGRYIDEIATFVIPANTFSDGSAVQEEDIFSQDGNMMCNIMTNVTYPDFAIVGSAGAIEQTNFIRMRVTSGGEGAYKPYNGSTYYIDIL